MESVIATNVPTPAVLKNRLRLQQFWKTDSDSRLRLQQFWKLTPTPDSSWKHATPDSDSTTLDWPHCSDNGIFLVSYFLKYWRVSKNGRKHIIFKSLKIGLHIYVKLNCKHFFFLAIFWCDTSLAISQNIHALLNCKMASLLTSVQHI